MAYTDIWWTAPTEADNGNLIIVTGRDKIDDFITSGKYIYRIEVKWVYEGGNMPDTETSMLMEEATEAMKATFKKDRAAVLTGIYPGDGERDWVFYTKSLNIFNGAFNRALSELPQLPITIEAFSDPDWEEYREMREHSYIPDQD
jgi:hypothetical protein